MKKLDNLVLFRILYFLVYFSDALFTPFYGLYLQGLGFDPVQVGVLLGLIPFSACLGSLLFGRLATSFRQNLLLMKILILGEAVGVILLGFIPNFYALIAVVIFLSFLNGVFYQIEDGASSYAVSKEGKTYNSVRVFGSLGFGVSLFVCALLLNYLSYSWIFLIAGCLFFLGFFLMFFIQGYPEERTALPSEENKSHPFLFKNPSYVFFFLFLLLLNGSINIEAYFLPLYLNALGFSDSQYSLFNGLRVAIEIIVVLLYPLIKRWLKSEKNCLLFGSVLLLVSCLGVVVSDNPWVIASLNNVFRGAGGALLIVGFVGYLSSILPHESLTNGLAVCVAGMNIFTGSFNFAAPSIYQATSFSLFFLILLFIALLGFVFLFFAKDERRAKNS
jgi:MFS transporter, PPP family, 3-phenylpropionic acid transporter